MGRQFAGKAVRRDLVSVFLHKKRRTLSDTA